MGTEEESKPEQAIVLHLEEIVLDGHETVFGAICDVLGGKSIELTRTMFCVHCVSKPVSFGLSAILKSAGRERLSEDKLLLDVRNAVKDAFTKKSNANDAIVKSLRKHAGNGVAIGAVSMFDDETADIVLERAGLKDVLAKVETCGSNGFGTPTSDTWLRLAKGLKVIPPRCVSVASSGGACRSALFAGMRAVAYASPSTAHQDFGGADAVVDELSDVPGTVASILDQLK